MRLRRMCSRPSSIQGPVEATRAQMIQSAMMIEVVSKSCCNGARWVTAIWSARTVASELATETSPARGPDRMRQPVRPDPVALLPGPDIAESAGPNRAQRLKGGWTGLPVPLNESGGVVDEEGSRHVLILRTQEDCWPKVSPDPPVVDLSLPGRDGRIDDNVNLGYSPSLHSIPCCGEHGNCCMLHTPVLWGAA